MKNLTFSQKWYEILKSYPVEIRNEVFAAVMEYAFSGKIIDMQPTAHMAFDFIKYELDERAVRREARKAKKAQEVGEVEVAKVEQVSKSEEVKPQAQKEKPEQNVCQKPNQTPAEPEKPREVWRDPRGHRATTYYRVG